MEKRMCLIVITVCLFKLTCSAQFENPVTAKSAVAVHRIPLVKSNLDLSESHEVSFWSLYEEYRREHEKNFSYNYFDLTALMQGAAMDEAEAENCVNTLFSYQYNDLALKKEFFDRLSERTNAVVALQFLQTEQLLDVMLKAELYEQTVSSEKKARFSKGFVKNREQGKKNFLLSALMAEEDKGFTHIYDLYEFEKVRVVGDDLIAFVAFMDDISDVTPGQAKQLADEYLTLLRGEVKLKEKYFIEMTKVGGSYLSARFMAFEEYFCIAEKLAACAKVLKQ